MIAQWITDPSPVWDKIKSRLMDDTGELETSDILVGIFDGQKMVGAFSGYAFSSYCYGCHGGVIPEYFGRGPEICELACRMFFHSTPCLKIVAIIPKFNTLMRKCVQKIGMKQEGVLTKSFLKWSRLHDQIIYGITKGEMRCRQQQ